MLTSRSPRRPGSNHGLVNRQNITRLDFIAAIKLEITLLSKVINEICPLNFSVAHEVVCAL